MMTPGQVLHLRRVLLYLLRSKHADIELALWAELMLLTRYLRLKLKRGGVKHEDSD